MDSQFLNKDSEQYEPFDFKCLLPNKYFDLLKILDDRLTTLEEKNILWGFLKGTFSHDSMRHDAFPFVLRFMINSKKVEDALTLFFANFHLCHTYESALHQLLEILQFQHSLFSYDELLLLGQGQAKFVESLFGVAV
jgi:hypothetical protein